jgi:hypothetical protein
LGGHDFGVIGVTGVAEGVGVGCGSPRTHAPLSSRTSPGPQEDGGTVFFSVCAGHCRRSFGSTGAGQHSPLVVTFAGTQHWPWAVGTKPAAQHCGCSGSQWKGSHFVPSELGVSPIGQHCPVEVAWLFRQQAPFNAT